MELTLTSVKSIDKLDSTTANTELDYWIPSQWLQANMLTLVLYHEVFHKENFNDQHV